MIEQLHGSLSYGLSRGRYDDFSVCIYVEGMIDQMCTVFLKEYIFKFSSVLRGHVLCVSSDDYVMAQVKDTQCLVTKWWLETLFLTT